MNFMIRNIIRIRRVCFSFARGYIKMFYVPVHADFIFKLMYFSLYCLTFISGSGQSPQPQQRCIRQTPVRGS